MVQQSALTILADMIRFFELARTDRRPPLWNFWLLPLLFSRAILVWVASLLLGTDALNPGFGELFIGLLLEVTKSTEQISCHFSLIIDPKARSLDFVG
jgi:hypothetical protein